MNHGFSSWLAGAGIPRISQTHRSAYEGWFEQPARSQLPHSVVCRYLAWIPSFLRCNCKIILPGCARQLSWMDCIREGNRLSAVSYRLSAVSYRLSAFSRAAPAIPQVLNYPLGHGWG